MMNLIACAILAGIITSSLLFVLASFRLARIADDTRHADRADEPAGAR